MKKLLFILSFFVVFISESFGASSVLAPGFTRCTVNTTSLNMRCGPSKNYTIVKTLKYGACAVSSNLIVAPVFIAKFIACKLESEVARLPGIYGKVQSYP